MGLKIPLSGKNRTRSWGENMKKKGKHNDNLNRRKMTWQREGKEESRTCGYGWLSQESFAESKKRKGKEKEGRTPQESW